MGDFLLAFYDNPDNNITSGAGLDEKVG